MPRNDDWVRVTGRVYNFIEGWPARNCTCVRVFYTLDADYVDDPCFLTQLAWSFLFLRPSRSESADQAQARAIFHSETELVERRRLPRRLTYGVPVYVQDVRAPLDYFYDGFDRYDQNKALIACEVETVEDGRLEALPLRPGDAARWQRERIDLVGRRGVRTHALRVQANPLLFKPGTCDLPGLVLISFERDLPNRTTYLAELAERMYPLKDHSPRTRDEAGVADILSASDTGAAYHRRRKLPLGFTGGPIVYACDFWFHRPYLRGGFLTDADEMLPCVAEPGDTGGIEHAPAES